MQRMTTNFKTFMEHKPESEFKANPVYSKKWQSPADVYALGQLQKQKKWEAFWSSFLKTGKRSAGYGIAIALFTLFIWLLADMAHKWAIYSEYDGRIKDLEAARTHTDQAIKTFTDSFETAVPNEIAIATNELFQVMDDRMKNSDVFQFVLGKKIINLQTQIEQLKDRGIFPVRLSATTSTNDISLIEIHPPLCLTNQFVGFGDTN